MKVTYTVEFEPETDVPVRGNAMGSGDDAFDCQCEDEILADLEAGNMYAWCCARVTAHVEIAGVEFEGYDTLGAISANSYRDAVGVVEANDMRSEAYKDLRRHIVEFLDTRDSAPFAFEIKP